MRSVFGRLASDHIRRQFQIARETLHIPNPGWVPDAAWDIIRAYWRSPQFKALQEQNKKNRNADGFAGKSGYRGGRISTYAHRQRLVRKNYKIQVDYGSIIYVFIYYYFLTLYYLYADYRKEPKANKGRALRTNAWESKKWDVPSGSNSHHYGEPSLMFCL